MTGRRVKREAQRSRRRRRRSRRRRRRSRRRRRRSRRRKRKSRRRRRRSRRRRQTSRRRKWKPGRNSNRTSRRRRRRSPRPQRVTQRRRSLIAGRGPFTFCKPQSPRRPSPTRLSRLERRPAQRVPNCTPEPAIRCTTSAKYRTINGQCNNLRHPRWGSHFRGLRRLFDSTYDDGVFVARSKSAAGGLLETSRKISAATLRSDSDAGAGHYTMSVVTFGQFMDHDLSISPHFQLQNPNGTLSPIECCDKKGLEMPASLKHPQCLPISVPASDPFYKKYKIRCMNFVRSIPAPDPLCRPRPATQINELTGWMDCSQVYGTTDEKAHELRAFKAGLLKTSTGNMLPREIPQPATNCTGRVCFIAGDERVNENTLLTLFHTVFVREHNRVARELAKHHRWTDETLYQEARRIVIGQWQHIAYHEWLPSIVGFAYAHSVGLTGFRPRAYVPFLNPDVSNEFSTAGFRLHSMVRGVIELVSKIGSIRKRLKLQENFFRPDSLVVSNVFTEMARGLTRQQPQTFGPTFAKAVHGNLFKVDAVGLDLMALNIQRGRDHGIPTYATVAARCHGLRISGWSDLLSLMTAADTARLKRSYRHWRDIDLFVGINTERPAPGALVGPTTRCLITDQFLRARYGDRFFYDQAGQRGSFTTAQLREIRKASWARLLCDNVGRGFDAVQPLAFIKPINFLGLNPVVSCNSRRIQRLDLSKF
ncbi:peroxidase-like [Pollicipes pollicipes]|uniref:peroxidase-like n=1 Tax=Pollicipes pollicipes TaxID=41117 RepID=UPI0018855B28|nr:peroxidase-like [Pollicipes pollicipes]